MRTKPFVLHHNIPCRFKGIQVVWTQQEIQSVFFYNSTPAYSLGITYYCWVFIVNQSTFSYLSFIELSLLNLLVIWVGQVCRTYYRIFSWAKFTWRKRWMFLVTWLLTEEKSIQNLLQVWYAGILHKQTPF